MLPTIPAVIKSSLFATGMLERAGRAGEVRIPTTSRIFLSEAHAGRVVNVAGQAKVLAANASTLPEADGHGRLGGVTLETRSREIGNESAPRWWQLSSISALDIILSAPHI
ncbi:hypothetical protein HDZ31DRAFT_62646 [Schizophyllum fasciatum]